jgi:hypothetical protein
MKPAAAIRAADVIRAEQAETVLDTRAPRLPLRLETDTIVTVSTNVGHSATGNRGTSADGLE